jgi:hypothetical protein
VFAIRPLLTAIGALLVGVGFIGFFSTFLLSSVPACRELRRVELPLGTAAGVVAVESCGRLFVGSETYGRVQVYDLTRLRLRPTSGVGGDRRARWQSIRSYGRAVGAAACARSAQLRPSGLG